jgi:hypothetical protein
MEEIRQMVAAVKTPEPPTWPGTCEAIDRPDLMKLALARFVEKGRLNGKMKELERRFLQGPLHFFPDIDHWAGHIHRMGHGKSGAHRRAGQGDLLEHRRGQRLSSVRGLSDGHLSFALSV